MRLKKCYILIMSENTAYEQKDLNMVVSEPIRNPWVEMGLNAKAYFEAYRGQCRLRISYARRSRALLAADYISNHIDCDTMSSRKLFWSRSENYWKKKLKESFRREKDYIEGRWMDDTELKTTLAMRCKEYNKEIHKRLIDRMDHMSDDPDALLKHFAHLVEVYNNQVWIIHIYREYITAINRELYAQCNAAKEQGTKLNTGNFAKVMGQFNQRLNEARELCTRYEPDSFMKTGIFKITQLKKDEPADTPVFKTPRNVPEKPDFNDDTDTIRAYLLLRFPWLMTGPEPVDFYYIGVNDAMMKVFRAETKRGSFVDFMYNQYQEVQWFKELLTWPFPEEHPEVEHEMYKALYGGSKNA